MGTMTKFSVPKALILREIRQSHISCVHQAFAHTISGPYRPIFALWPDEHLIFSQLPLMDVCAYYKCWLEFMSIFTLLQLALRLTPVAGQDPSHWRPHPMPLSLLCADATACLRNWRSPWDRRTLCV